MATVISDILSFNHGAHFKAHALRAAPDLINPFIGVDHAWMGGPTFPPHSHVGISAVSYLFLDSETSIINRDSIGTRNLIRPGGLHWTTAGHGIVHEEVPAESGKTVHSLQIFVSLGSAGRSIAPSALNIEPDDVPVIRAAGSSIRIPIGSLGSVRSPIKPPTDVTLLDISLEEFSTVEIPVEAGLCAFVVPVAGHINVDGQSFQPQGLKFQVLQRSTTSKRLRLAATEGNAHVVLFIGNPVH